MSDDYLPLFILLALAGLLLAGMFRARAALHGTTLLAPWRWLLSVVIVLVGSEMIIAYRSHAAEPAWSDAVRYAAAMLTFAPGMAVLGAKRPQDRGWQWVVLTLWLVLSMPAVQMAAYGMGPRVQPALAWKLLVGVLLFLEGLNYAISRYRWGAALFIAAQLVLLWQHWGGPSASGLQYVAIALGLFGCGGILVAARRLDSFSTDDPCTRIWKRFIDEYGSLWSFRVIGLVNQSAEAVDWPVRLMPFGFTNAQSGASVRIEDQATAVQHEVRKALRNTLRRFYSVAQMAELDAPDEAPSDTES